MAKNLIQVFEYSNLKIGESGFKEHHFDALVKYNEKNKNLFFTVGRKKITFNQFVGIIRVRDLTIEILPKAEKRDEEEDEKLKDKWKKALIEMIKISKNIKLKSYDRAELEIHKSSILDIYFQSFLQECETIVHQGLVKKYRTIKRNAKALKGKLLISEQITKNFIHKEKFWVEYQQYDENNLYNQILLKAIKVLLKTTSNSTLISKSLNLTLFFGELKDIKVSEKLFQNIVLDRKTERYKNALILAKLILLNYSPSVSTGAEDVLAILFDMNALYEKYIFKMLKRAAQKLNEEIEIEEQKRLPFWEERGIKPDILIKRGTTITIIDTKWKVLKELKPADSDLKQIFVYNKYYGSTCSYLLYPNVYNLGDLSGEYRYDKSKCIISFTDLFKKDGNLDKEIGFRIMKLLET